VKSTDARPPRVRPRRSDPIRSRCCAAARGVLGASPPVREDGRLAMAYDLPVPRRVAAGPDRARPLQQEERVADRAQVRRVHVGALPPVRQGVHRRRLQAGACNAAPSRHSAAPQRAPTPVRPECNVPHGIPCPVTHAQAHVVCRRSRCRWLTRDAAAPPRALPSATARWHHAACYRAARRW
jgi:hypothetical protein